MNAKSISANHPSSLSTPHARAGFDLLIILLGIVALAALAQVSLPLPFTSVPITGQTFGVALLSLLGGLRRAPWMVAGYLLTGSLGLPVFAGGASGMHWGPTTGYLLGMVLSAAVMGSLADRGWSRTFLRAYLACLLGSAITFLAGMIVLSHFIPSEKSVILLGLVPFLPGDLIKTILAASIASTVRKGAV